MKNNKTSWGNVADWYDGLLEKSGDSYQEKVILPNLLRLVGPKPDMKVLDVACGQGYFSRFMHEKGAKVVGTDISSELIALAKRNSPKEVAYIVSPADTIAAVESINKNKYDAITIILALQNIENFVGVLEQCSTLLNKKGRLYFVINHPAFRIPKRSDWGWDDERKVQYRRIDRYMSDEKNEIDMRPGEKNANKKEFTVSFHRPLQSYFKALNKTGFVVSKFEEWISHKKSEPGPRGKEEDRMRKEIPIFLCVEARLAEGN